MAAIGSILLYRQLRNNPLWQDQPFAKGQAWIDLLMLANFADGQAFLKGQVVQIKRGQLIRSLDTLAVEWGWSVKKVRTFLTLLNRLNMATSEGTPQGTLITIENYDAYQHDGQANDTGEDTVKGKQGASRGQRKNKNNKNKKELKNIYGEYQNVKLSAEDMEHLMKEFPADYQERIERLSEYMASTGKGYKNHLATIRAWAIKEKQHADSGRDHGAKGKAASPDRKDYDYEKFFE